MFDYLFYLNLYLICEKQVYKMILYQHYIKYGKKEGRIADSKK